MDGRATSARLLAISPRTARESTMSIRNRRTKGGRMRKLLFVLAAGAVGVAISLGFASRSHSTPKPGCGSLAVPVESDHNLVHDPQTGYLHINTHTPPR